MITEQDLQEAIAECEGERNPNANTCIKLAAFYTIKNQMYGGTPITHSFSPGPKEVDTSYRSDTEFYNLVKDRDYDEVLSVMDEVMSTLEIVNPRLYNGIIRKLS